MAERAQPNFDFRTIRLGVREAVQALRSLAREAGRDGDAALVEAFLALAHRLGRPEALDGLLASRLAPEAEAGCGGIVLEYRAAEVVDAVLDRLNQASDVATRRVYFGVALVLGRFPELKPALAHRLARCLTDQRWFVVRNAIVLLSMVGPGLSRRHWSSLARSPERQVRIALAQELGRWLPDRDARDRLILLLEDSHPGVRFAAAVALTTFLDARACQALARRCRVELDAEVWCACQAALKRRRPPIPAS